MARMTVGRMTQMWQVADLAVHILHAVHTAVLCFASVRCDVLRQVLSRLTSLRRP